MSSPFVAALPPSSSSSTTTATGSSSSSSSSTTITPTNVHSCRIFPQTRQYPSPIARPSSNMSTSPPSDSSAASSPCLSLNLLSSLHTRDFSAPVLPTSVPENAPGSALRVSQSQPHIRSSSAGVGADPGGPIAISRGNSFSNNVNSFSTAASPDLSPFVSPQLDNNIGALSGVGSPVLESNHSQRQLTRQPRQPFSPRLMAFLRAQAHEREDSSGSVSSSSTKAYSTSSAGSYSSVEIISSSNDASFNIPSSLGLSASSSGHSRGSDTPGLVYDNSDVAPSLRHSSTDMNMNNNTSNNHLHAIATMATTTPTASATSPIPINTPGSAPFSSPSTLSSTLNVNDNLNPNLSLYTQTQPNAQITIQAMAPFNHKDTNSMNNTNRYAPLSLSMDVDPSGDDPTVSTNTNNDIDTRSTSAFSNKSNRNSPSYHPTSFAPFHDQSQYQIRSRANSQSSWSTSAGNYKPSPNYASSNANIDLNANANTSPKSATFPSTNSDSGSGSNSTSPTYAAALVANLKGGILQSQKQQEQASDGNANTKANSDSALAPIYLEAHAPLNSSSSLLSSSNAPTSIQLQNQNQTQETLNAQDSYNSNTQADSANPQPYTIYDSAESINNSDAGVDSSSVDQAGTMPNVYINGLPPHFPDESLYMMTREFGPVLSVRTFTRHIGERLSGYGFVLFEAMDAAQRCIDSLRKYRNLHPSFSKVVHRIPGTPFNPAMLQQSDSMNSNTSIPMPNSASSLSIPSSHSYSDGLASPADDVSYNGGGGNIGEWKTKERDGKEKDKLSDKEKESFKAKMEKLKDTSSTNLYIEGLPMTIDDSTLSGLISPYKIKSFRFFQTKLSNPPRIIAFVRLETRQAAEDIIQRLHGRVVRGWNDNGARISVRFADSNEQRELRVTKHRPSSGKSFDRTFQRAERIARGEDEDPASKSRLSMAQAALLNMRGSQMQAQLQDEARVNMPKGSFAGTADGFGQLQSNRSHQLPIHPLTISPTGMDMNTMLSPAFGPNAVPNSNFALNGLMTQMDSTFKGGRYVEPFASATNAQTPGQAQEYARLLDSMSLGGLNANAAGMEYNFDARSNSAAIAAAALRNPRSPLFRLPELPPVMASDMGLPAMTPSVMAQAQTLALLQQQREHELYRLQQQQVSRALRGPSTQSTKHYSALETNIARMMAQPQQAHQPQMNYQRQQMAAFPEMSPAMSSPFTDGNYASSPEFNDQRGQQNVSGANSQRHSAPSSFSTFLHQQRARTASENGTPFVSPALTYASRTPATLSPATPFFGFNTPNLPPLHQHSHKLSANNGGSVGVDMDGAGANMGLKPVFQH